MFRALSALVITVVVHSTSIRATAASDPAGLWVGRGHAVRTADLDVVTIATTYTSQFSFRVAADGGITGDAVVTYQLDFNDAKLRALLAQANAAASAPLRTIPQLGGLLDFGMSSRDAIGMRMSYDEGTSVRRGAIGGSSRDGRITLRWSAPPEPIKYQKYLVFPFKERSMTPGAHPAYTPWLGEATIAEPLPGQLLATAAGNSSTVRREDVTYVTTWTAERRATAR